MNPGARVMTPPGATCALRRDHAPIVKVHAACKGLDTPCLRVPMPRNRVVHLPSVRAHMPCQGLKKTPAPSSPNEAVPKRGWCRRTQTFIQALGCKSLGRRFLWVRCAAEKGGQPYWAVGWECGGLRAPTGSEPIPRSMRAHVVERTEVLMSPNCVERLYKSKIHSVQICVCAHASECLLCRSFRHHFATCSF